jgi:hypothetical protein
MPTETSYGPYTISTMPGGNGVHAGKLQEEIEDAASGISIQVKGVDTTPTTFTVVMKDVLPAGEKTTLDGGGTQAANDPPSGGSILGDHDGTPPDGEPLIREDGVLYAVPKAASYGLVMNERDFRLNTGIFTEAASLEDRYFNPFTKQEESWGELSLEGCYKLDAGNYVACTDQTDADANACLSIWDYAALQPGTSNEIKYELRDGYILADPAIFANPSAPTDAERFGHRVYAVVAPGIPGNLGGSVAFFDGYLGRRSNLKLEATSPQTQVMDPGGQAGAAGSLLRLALYYPAGTKHSHVVSLVSYRALGTFHPVI